MRAARLLANYVVAIEGVAAALGKAQVVEHTDMAQHVGGPLDDAFGDEVPDRKGDVTFVGALAFELDRRRADSARSSDRLKDGPLYDVFA